MKNGQGIGVMTLPDLELFSVSEINGMLRLLDRCMKTADRRGGVPAARRKAGGRAGKIIFDVLFYGLLLCLIGGALLISRGSKKPVFGYSFMNVISGSMQSVYPVDSLVVIKGVDKNTIRIGDDITYMKDAETAVTHRVIGITEEYDGSGERGFETQGVDNDAPDFEIVRAANVVGVIKYHVPKVGQWLEWLRGNLAITLCFTAGIVLLVILLKGAFKKAPDDKNKQEKKKQTADSMITGYGY